MKVSIAMATYNGGRHIQEQLDSFVGQTRLPDELIVCDDDSSDDTVTILERFAETAPFSVWIIRNDVNIGYAKNFAKAMSLCRGDLVFLSDQDDVWMKKKIKSVMEIAGYARTDGGGLLLNDAVVTDESLKPIASSHFFTLRKKGRGEASLTLGCCMAIQRDLLDKCLPVPESIDGHDKWISDIALALGEKQLVEEPLQYYRRHGGNASSALVYRAGRWVSIASKVGRAIFAFGRRTADPVLLRKAQHMDHVLERVSEIVCSKNEVMSESARMGFTMRERDELWFRVRLRKLPFFRRVSEGVLGLSRRYLGNYRSRFRKMGSDLWVI